MEEGYSRSVTQAAGGYGREAGIEITCRNHWGEGDKDLDWTCVVVLKKKVDSKGFRWHFFFF